MFLSISLIASLEEESINGSKLLHFRTKKNLTDKLNISLKIN